MSLPFPRAWTRGEGTLGKLLTNSEIHDNLNLTVLEMTNTNR